MSTLKNYQVSSSPVSVFNCTGIALCQPWAYITLVQIPFVGSVELCDFPIVPSCIIAVLEGIIFAIWLLHSNKTKPIVGARAYSVTFLLYGLMMTCGMVTHSIYLVECHLAPFTLGWYMWGLSTDIFTSIIAVSFFYNGLIDMGWLNESRPLPWLCMALSYISIAVAYLKGISRAILYAQLVLTTCSFYLLCQFAIIMSRCSAPGLKYAFMAGISGAVGFSAVVLPKINCEMCQEYGTAAAGAWLWYYCSDAAIFFLGIYVIKSRSIVTAGSEYTAVPTSDHSDNENDSDDVLVTVPKSPSSSKASTQGRATTSSISLTSLSTASSEVVGRA